LDLTTPQVERMEESHKVGCSGGGGVFVTGGPYQPPKITFRLEIVRFSTHRLSHGQGLVADLQLTNTGANQVQLPWDPDEYLIYGKDCSDLDRPSPSGTVVGSLSIKLVGNSGQGVLVGGHYLYARIDQPETYRVLRPGQSAVIRVGGKLSPPHAGKEASAVTDSKQFKLVAAFDLTDSKVVNPYETITSVNSVAVETSGGPKSASE
jgi:hypothetical protein